MSKQLNDYKFIRIIKWGIYYIFRSFVKLEHVLYFKFKAKKKKKIKRLFATTGCISLINALAIIAEIGDFENYEDTLIIETGKGRKTFLEQQKEIASVHKFKVIEEVGLSSGVIAVLHNQYAFDEVYALNHLGFINTLLPLYTKAKIILTDEGFGSLIDYNISHINNIEKFKTHKYLGKVDILAKEKLEKYTFEQVNMNKFKKICSSLSKKYPITYINNPDDKYILYCSIYWETTGTTRENFAQVQSETLNNLINAGYKILYKPHPRDNDNFGYDKNPNVQFIDTKFPVELYEFDIVALVGVCCGTTITYPHFWGIPGFSNLSDKLKKEENFYSDAIKNTLTDIHRIIYKYSPSYEYLLQLDVKNTSKEELKKQIKNYYEEFLNSKPLLSENYSYNN